MSSPSPLPSRSDVIRAHKDGGGKVAAVFPIHYPRALFRAFGVLPVEVWGPPGMDTTAGDAHLQAYTCNIVRSGLSFLLSPRSAFADLFLVPHACDSMQGLGSVLLDFLKPERPVLTYYLPKGEQGALAAGFLAEELKRLAARLSELTGKTPSTAELSACVEREEGADVLLGRLLGAQGKLSLGERAFYELLRSREYLPAERFAERAQAALEEPPAKPRKGVKLVLSGIVPEPMDVLDALQRAGAQVVGDDFACTGRRVYPRGTSADPYRRMAESLLGAAPDCTRGSSIHERVRHLEGLAKGSGAKAVLFFEVKFCEPEQFYLPQVRKALDAAGLRSLVVEVNPGEGLPDQVVTRLEALVETVG